LDKERHLAVAGDDPAGAGSLNRAFELGGECRPVHLVGTAVVEVRAAAATKVVLENRFNIVPGIARDADTAREYGEGHIDITSSAGDGLVIVGDGATRVVGKTIPNIVVLSSEGNIDGAIVILCPDALSRGSVGASVEGFVVTGLGLTTLGSPLPTAILVIIAARLSDMEVLALGGAKHGLVVPVAAIVAGAVLGEGQAFARFDTLRTGVQPQASLVSAAQGVGSMVGAAAGAVAVLPAALEVVQTKVIVEVPTNLAHAVISSIVPLTVGSSGKARRRVGVGTRAEAATHLADEHGLELGNLAHGVVAAAGLVVDRERFASARAYIGCDPFVPGAFGVGIASALVLEKLRAPANTRRRCRGIEAPLAASIGNTLTRGIKRETVSGAAVVDKVPNAAGSIASDLGALASTLRGVAVCTVLKALAIG
jgi:hypothetical protein